MANYLKVVRNHRASQGLRLANFVIDKIAIYSLFYGFGIFAGLAFNFFGIEIFLDIAYDIAEASRLTDALITALVALIYYFLFEYFSKGRTLGKYITGTQVVSIDGLQPGNYSIFIRSISRFVPFNAFSFLGENGWHDQWSDTRVVKKKNYEEARRLQLELEALGK